MLMERLLGLDIGDRYIGIAVSDPLRVTAQPYKTYKRGTREDDLEFFNDVITQFNVKTVVCGLPLNVDGTENKQTRKTINYANFLKNALGIENIEYLNEGMTTLEAGEIMELGGVKDRKQKKKKIDMIAAQIILQEYMDSQKKEEDIDE